MRDYPQSLCKCGHTGDGPMSQHNPGVMGLEEGHGSCKIVGCGCEQFTWVRFVTKSELIPHPTRKEYAMRGGRE